MRLTVRTLLAYLDGVLDKESSEVLSQKIAESSFAGDLAERVRTSVGNGQLSSPEPGAVHPIEDPNTIAEYLDNVLQAQHVPEVERVLIESDMHLSEAAACHQILTLVLSRPANVPTEMRDKMYRLSEKLRSQGHAGNGASGDSKPFDSQIPTRDASVSDSVPSAAGGLSAPGTVLPDGSAADLGAADVGAAPFPAASTLSPAKSNGHVSGAPVPSSPRPSVPDYLRSGRPSRVLPALLTLVLLAVLGFIVVKAFQQPLRNIADKTNVITPENPLRVDPEKVGPDGFGPTGETPGMVAAAQPAPADDSDSNAERSEPASFRDPETNVTPTTPAPAPAEPESTEPAPSPKDPTPVSADPVNPAMVETPGANPAAPPAVTETAESPVAPVVPEMIEPVEDPAPAKVEIQSIGKLTTSDSLLLAQSSDGKWIRVAVDGALMSRTRIVNPPTFRNVVALKDGLNVTLVGAGELSIDVDADGNVQLFVEYGRFLIRSETPGSTLGISMHGNSGLLTLPEATSVVGVHVTEFRLAGADPRAGGKAEPVIAIQATEGEASVNWLEGSAECGINPGELSLATGDRWAAHCSNASISKAADLAPWVLGPAGGVSIESTARKGLLDQIVENKTIEMSLRESVSFRRSEVAALGARTLLLMGFCDDYFGADGILRNEAQKSHWTEHFLALQAMIDRGGDAADALSQSLQQMDAAEAKVLYDTLVSYSDQQLAAGADFDLVEGLNSTSMPLRVLSSEALRQITGTTYYFRPHDKNAARRSPTVKRWDTRQKKGDIRWEKKQLPLALLDE